MVIGVRVDLRRPAGSRNTSPSWSSRTGAAVEPSPRNGLRKSSQLMVDKLFTVPMQAVGEVVGQTHQIW